MKTVKTIVLHIQQPCTMLDSVVLFKGEAKKSIIKLLKIFYIC